MKVTVKEVIDALLEPFERLDKTVDTLKFGDPDSAVTGIVTAFMPTQHVLEQAIRQRANLVIAHEGPFFTHHDGAEPREDDPVYGDKRQLIESSGLALFRFHDYIHRAAPDGIMEGLIRELGWTPYVHEHQRVSSVVTLPPMTLSELADTVKKRLDLPFLRVMGNPDMACRKIGLLAGYRGGGANALPLLASVEDLDVILYGEGPEWETPEYIRDALHQGKRKGLIVLGHAESEEPGMKLLAERLQERYPGLPVNYVKETPLFTVC